MFNYVVLYPENAAAFTKRKQKKLLSPVVKKHSVIFFIYDQT